MAKPAKVTNTHDKLQEVVDGSRLMQSGIRNEDAELVGAGWQRVSNVRGGGFAKKLFDNFKSMLEGQPPQGGSPESKG